MKNIFKRDEESLGFLSFSKTEHLNKMRPRDKYVFSGDYYQVDNSYCCVMSFFHNVGALDAFCAFWGLHRIPSGLSDDIKIISIEQTRRMKDSWLKSRRQRMEGIVASNSIEQSRAGSEMTKSFARVQARDFADASAELMNGAAYLSVTYKLIVKAPSLEALDEAVKHIKMQYIDRMSSVTASPFVGEQRNELSRLFDTNEQKVGKPFYFTSTEYAGSHSLVTRGIEDVGGEYVGYMVGDVNNSAIIFDVDNYKSHNIFASSVNRRDFGNSYTSDMWGSKVSQAAMLNNKRVVHLILNGCDLDNMGPDFKNLTYKIDLSKGDLNMFEMFGESKDELSIFSAQIEKILLMAEQFYEDDNKSIIQGALRELLKEFYVGQRMWYSNAEANRDKLRVVGIPHNQVPTLDIFIAYLKSARKAEISGTVDNFRLQAINVLDSVFSDMLSRNGDLFNTVTSDMIDGAKDGTRVIYDFGDLSKRGKGVTMAQLVNSLGYALNCVGPDDLVVIHGADFITPNVKPYVSELLSQFAERGGRVSYIYKSVQNALSDTSFNHLNRADYLCLGSMTRDEADKYEKVVGMSLPEDLKELITQKSDKMSYLRRGFDNVVFSQDLPLGVTPERMKLIRERNNV